MIRSVCPTEEVPRSLFEESTLRDYSLILEDELDVLGTGDYDSLRQ